jgi:putative transposase
VNKKVRAFQVWKRNPLSIELSSQKVFLQKMEYIQKNPDEAGLTLYPEAYRYSSASFYETGVDHYNMLTQYMG